MTAQIQGQIEEELAVWNVYCSGESSECVIAKEPVGQLMFPQFGSKIDWDTATAWLNEWKAENNPAVWNIYRTGNQSKCVIAKEPTSDYMFKALGPVDWDTANAWLNNWKPK